MLLPGLVACGGDEPEQNQTNLTKQQAQIFKGHAIYGHEVRSFLPCDTDEALWVIDKQGTLWQLHKEPALHQQPYAKLFAIVKGRRGPAPRDGFGAEYAGSLSIEDVLYIATEGFDCNYNWQQFSFRALGNEPFWSATILADSITINRMGKPEISYTKISKQQTEQSVRYQGKSKENISMELEILTKPCRDTMSGAYYGLTARLKLDGKELGGCAIQGDAD
jgi:putative lipoprotein